MILILAAAAPGCTSAPASHASRPDPWDSLNTILAQIKAPVFPAKDFLLPDYGAIEGGKADCSTAFKKAIEACSTQGGGRVLVPEGIFLTGPIYLKSNVDLHLQKGARIVFSTHTKDYLPLQHVRWEGVELMNYAPLVYAYKEKNIAITGEGVLDGQANASNWWPWKGGKDWVKGTPSQNDSTSRPALMKMNKEGVPVENRKFGEGFYLRPQFFQPYQCDNILLEGVTFKNSPMWNITPVLCSNITIRKVRVEGTGPNTDGCDPESCRNVLIKDCYFDTGDDCIAIKSGRNQDGRAFNIPCENIVIQGCTMANGHGGVAIGSEISGGIKNVFAEDCRMSSPALDRAIRIKSSPERGGVNEKIYVRNITVGQVAQEVVVITMHYKGESGDYLPVFRNIEIRDMKVENGGKIGILLEGYPEQPIEQVRFQNIDIKNTGLAVKCNDTAGIVFDNVSINGKKLDTERK